MKYIKENKYYILITLVTIILLSKFFILPRLYGHDTAFHIGNITALSKTINLKNIFGLNLVTFESNIFGYGTYLFYPKIPHLIAAYLLLLTKNIYTSMGIVYFITTLLSGIFMYLLANKIFNNKKVSFIASLIYMTIPYHIGEIYIRDAFAENFMFMANPLIFLGIYSLKEDDYKIFFLTFIPGYIIGMNSHLLSMIFVTIFIGLYILFNIKKFFTKKKILSLLLSTLIVTGITLPFLVTIIEHRIFDMYIVFKDNTITSRTGVLQSVISLKDYINQIPYYDMITVFFNYTTIISIFLVILLLIIKRKDIDKEISKKQINLLLFIIIIIVIMTSNTLWNHIPKYLLNIQFIWRLCVILDAFIALLAASLFIHYNDKIIHKITYPIIAILIVVEGFLNINYYGPLVLTNENVTNTLSVMGWSLEYLPVTALFNDKNYPNPNFLIRDNSIQTENENIKINIINDSFPNLEFKVENVNERTILELPRMYYLGYELVNKNNEQQELSINYESGLTNAKIFKSDTYYLTYKGTKLYKISKVIRTLTLLSILVLLIIYKNFKRKEIIKNNKKKTNNKKNNKKKK